MPTEIFVAVLSLIGTLVGSLAGIMVSNKLTNYRLEKLEQQVNKHNNIMERTFLLEGRMTEAEHRITNNTNGIKENKENFRRVHPPTLGG